MTYIFEIPDSNFVDSVLEGWVTPAVEVSYEYDFYQGGSKKMYSGNAVGIPLDESIDDPRKAWEMIQFVYNSTSETHLRCFGMTDLERIFSLPYYEALHRYSLFLERLKHEGTEFNTEKKGGLMFYEN